MQLIYTFVLAHAKTSFSHDMAQFNNFLLNFEFVFENTHEWRFTKKNFSDPLHTTLRGTLDNAVNNRVNKIGL